MTNISLASPSSKIEPTGLHRNPFWILGVTARDDRRRIVELAEEKALTLDHDLCQKARSDLTNPRTRLTAELSWLPGVSPTRAQQLAHQALIDPMAIRKETGLPALAFANLMAASFEAMDGQTTQDEIVESIHEVAWHADDLAVEEVARDINEDRAISGFPEVKNFEQVEAELAERKRYYRNAVKSALDRMPSAALVAVMTDVVDSMTSGGEWHAPELIDDLVDSYETEAQEFLQKEAENVHKLIEAVRDAAQSGGSAIAALLDKLEAMTRNWQKVAHPIQLSAKARGISHAPSTKLAFAIRDLAVELFNQHNLLAQSDRITKMIQEIFEHIPELVDRTKQDAEDLKNIVQERAQTASREAEWEREITYSAEVGLVFKELLSISPNGVSWGTRRFPLEAITRIRWGSTRHSINGIPTGTTFSLAFGDARSEAVVELRREQIFSTFIDKLWRAVGVRLLTELLADLKAGREVSFDNAVIRDDGATLMRRKFFGSEPVPLHWHQIHVWSYNGAFIIASKDDKKTFAQLPYITTPNAHILERGILMAFKKPGMRRLSDLFKDD